MLKSSRKPTTRLRAALPVISTCSAVIAGVGGSLVGLGSVGSVGVVDTSPGPAVAPAPDEGGAAAAGGRTEGGGAEIETTPSAPLLDSVNQTVRPGPRAIPIGWELGVGGANSSMAYVSRLITATIPDPCSVNQRLP